MGSLDLTADDEALDLIASYSSGDCRSAYNALEVAAQLAVADESRHIPKLATEAVQKRVLMYDKSGEEHYNLISALHKSVRNSDPDAALYWLARMFASGEDPLYLARRIVRMAIEDIGLAAPEALNLCLSAKETLNSWAPRKAISLWPKQWFISASLPNRIRCTPLGAQSMEKSNTPARNRCRCIYAMLRRA